MSHLKGTDCHVKAQTCDDKQQNPCGETGMCVEGFCQCQPGFTGPGCSEGGLEIICQLLYARIKIQRNLVFLSFFFNLMYF